MVVSLYRWKNKKNTILSPQKNKWNLSSSRFRIFVSNLRIMQIKVMKKCQVAYVNQMKTIKQFEGYKTE